MKAVFISYNQALTDRVQDVLDKRNVRGFTKWELTQGRGTSTGEPHYGNHTWPSMNSSVMAIMDDDKVPALMESLREVDRQLSKQGLRAFVWNVEDQL